MYVTKKLWVNEEINKHLCNVKHVGRYILLPSFSYYFTNLKLVDKSTNVEGQKFIHREMKNISADTFPIAIETMPTSINIKNGLASNSKQGLQWQYTVDTDD